MKPQRPLGLCSDFVVERMPLAHAHGSLPHELAKLTPPGSPSLDELPDEEARLALLDLTILERTAQMNECVPIWLPEAVNRLAQRLHTLPIVNYHLLIEANPLEEDPRLFTVDKAGQAELFFYERHLETERLLKRLLELGMALRKSFLRSEHAVPIVYTGVQLIIDDLVTMIKSMRRLGSHRGLRKHFDRLRPFWFSARAEIKEGPSGLSSTRVALMDILFTELDEEYGDSLKRRAHTLDPAFHKRIHTAWLQREDNFHAIMEASPEAHRASLAISMQRLGTALVEWRQEHIAAVHALIPAALKGAPGTGGENQVRELLKRRLRPAQELVRAAKKYAPVFHPETRMRRASLRIGTFFEERQIPFTCLSSLSLTVRLYFIILLYATNLYNKRVFNFTSPQGKLASSRWAWRH